MNDPADVERLREARARVLEQIAAACARPGRDPAGVTLVAVSKTVSAERLRAALEAGLVIFGENRVQEAAGKVSDVPSATWHLIGPLQSNKARRAVELFDTIETVDSAALARRLDSITAELRPGRRLAVLIQVNVDRDPGKAGVEPEALDALMDELEELEHLEIRGLMTIGRLAGSPDDARGTFVRLRQLSQRLRERGRALGPELSMGMTDDFPVAVEEGATIVRVGRAIFGERGAARP